MGCGNQVIQRGITRKLQIFFIHEGKGWGFRTLEQLLAGAFVCEYVGEILTNMEQEERNNNAKADPTVTHTYPILLDGDWCSEKGLKDEEALCLDATFFGKAARFINHRYCDGNLVDVPVTIESPDRHYYHIRCIVVLTLYNLLIITQETKLLARMGNRRSNEILFEVVM
ncbi:hypothetical protein R1sor_026494 [Riccia sorocarpa]|uniref:SET domain-containing protein n=1 Tax=Riccia sorocarpa TaxID=122646 RepID=A0ABD3GD77_9MARC